MKNIKTNSQFGNVSNEILLKKQILKKILAQINQGGLTYSPLLNKDYSGTPNIAISPFPERSQILDGKATKKTVLEFFKRNRDLFLKKFSLGAWFDKVSQKTYLDISAPIPLKKQAEAITLGKDANQIAGFNLSDFTEIPLGGNGQSDSIMIPFQNRLEQALTLIAA